MLLLIPCLHTRWRHWRSRHQPLKNWNFAITLFVLRIQNLCTCMSMTLSIHGTSDYSGIRTSHVDFFKENNTNFACEYPTSMKRKISLLIFLTCHNSLQNTSPLPSWGVNIVPFSTLDTCSPTRALRYMTKCSVLLFTVFVSKSFQEKP